MQAERHIVRRGLLEADGLAFLADAPSGATRDELLGSEPQVAIHSTERYAVTNNPRPVFVLDFGGRLAALDPLLLFNISGTNRTDVVYDVAAGRVFVVTHVPNPATPADLRIAPPGGGLEAAGLAANAAVAAALTAGAGASLVTSLLAPLASAGVMGHAMLALVAWAQRCFLLSSLPIGGMPLTFRSFGTALAWSVADVMSPLDALVDPAPRAAYEWERAFSPALIRLDPASGFSDALQLPLNSTDPLAALAISPQAVSASASAWLVRPEALQPRVPPMPHAALLAALGPSVEASLRPFFRELPAEAPQPPPSNRGQSAFGPAHPAAAAPAIAAGSGVYAAAPLRRALTDGVSAPAQNPALDPAVRFGSQYVVTSTGVAAASPEASRLTGEQALAAVRQIQGLLDQRGARWRRLVRAAFWVAAALVAAGACHAAALLALARPGSPVSPLLAAPRAELVLALAAAPALAAAGAGKPCLGLWAGGAGAAAAGAAAGAAPVLALGAWGCLAAARLQGTRARAAAFVLHPDPRRRLRPPRPSGRLERWLLAPLLGPVLPPGMWRDVRAPGGRCVARFGPCFEAARGPLMLLEGASFEADARGRVARGELVPAAGSLCVHSADAALLTWRGRVLLRRSSGQVYAPLAGVARATLTALLVGCLAGGAPGSPGIGGPAAVGALLAGALAHGAYLRAFVPFRWRGDQAAEAAGAAADALTLALALALPVLAPAAQGAAGAAMVAAQAAAGAAALLAAGARAGGALRRAAWPGGLLWLPPSGEQRVANAVRAAMRAALAGGPGVAERLARKYARRWLLKARRAAARRLTRNLGAGEGPYRAVAAALLEARGSYPDPNPSPRPASPLSPASTAGSRGLLPRGASWGSGGPVRRQHSGRHPWLGEGLPSPLRRSSLPLHRRPSPDAVGVADTGALAIAAAAAAAANASRQGGLSPARTRSPKYRTADNQ
ncbi:hypothetical protein WJX81_003336 [Elliptochloris bilobata]|uniref:Uncharacterized protein n=1 Tax=Elliptochloris bilobata TaxID=381761 RepID=A0AAW1S569_9CHLO